MSAMMSLVEWEYRVNRTSGLLALALGCFGYRESSRRVLSAELVRLGRLQRHGMVEQP